ncbi:response regulator transcription factor [Litorisediminicola beolgyonensis]|uniref:Response regulator transcription factor n=1 Tax=Litorisediminicola beolgyonensis TaxID=1173614 RepID=A0ABW3ZIY1_9RHOB
MTRPRILIVDDDPEITSALSRGLALHGYDTIATQRADTALDRLMEATPDAAIIDVMIGADSGIDLVRAIRGRGLTLPVVMLSALSEVEDRAAGLEAGADDYIVKPFSFDELIARLKVQERRAEAARPRPASFDPITRTLTLGPHSAQLTEREGDLLNLLLDHAPEVLSRGQIFDALWGADGSSNENIVDVYLGYLRKKLGAEEDFGFQIKTLRNKGFTLDGRIPLRSAPSS